MNNQDLMGALAGGGRYRVTPFMVEIADAAGTPVETIDRNDIKETQRKGNTVTIKRRKGKDVSLVGASLDDAGRLELALRGTFAAGAPPAPVLVKKGGGFGRFLMFGCGGLIGLVALVFIVIAATGGGGSSDDNNTASSGNSGSTPGQSGTNRGDVHVSLAEGSSGTIARERNDNKKSKVTYWQFVTTRPAPINSAGPPRGKNTGRCRWRLKTSAPPRSQA